MAKKRPKRTPDLLSLKYRKLWPDFASPCRRFRLLYRMNRKWRTGLTRRKPKLLAKIHLTYLASTPCYPIAPGCIRKLNTIQPEPDGYLLPRIPGEQFPHMRSISYASLCIRNASSSHLNFVKISTSSEASRVSSLSHLSTILGQSIAESVGVSLAYRRVHPTKFQEKYRRRPERLSFSTEPLRSGDFL